MATGRSQSVLGSHSVGEYKRADGAASCLRNKSSLGFAQRNCSQLPAHNKPELTYAPASVASPHSQHYAAISYPRGPGSLTYSESARSSRSGRDSALARLLDRVGGSLRRRGRRARPEAPDPAPSCSLIPPVPPPPPPPSQLDPDVFASGKRRLAAEEIYAEGIRAIDSNAQRRLLEHEVDADVMREGEVKTLIADQSRNQPEFKELVTTLVAWINDELASQRIIVRDLQDDLYDGQILGKLVERLQNVKLDLVEVTQNELIQKHKLAQVLDLINRNLKQPRAARWARIRWTVEGIHSKSLVEIIHLLVTLVFLYRAPVKLPGDVRVRVLLVQRIQARLVERSHEIQLTGPTVTPTLAHQLSLAQKRDVFDELLESAPDKLDLVKLSLARFVDRHLAKIKPGCLNLSQPCRLLINNKHLEQLDPAHYSDGLLLVFLISSLEDFFIPLGNLFTFEEMPSRFTIVHNQSKLADRAGRAKFVETDINNDIYEDTEPVYIETALEPGSFTYTQPIHKLHNVNFALQLIEEAGLDKIRLLVRAEDIVNADLKSLLRLLYALFSRYRHL